MSDTGRQKKLPSDLKSINVQINLNQKQKEKLDRICAAESITQSEYFRVFLAKDKR